MQVPFICRMLPKFRYFVYRRIMEDVLNNYFHVSFSFPMYYHLSLFLGRPVVTIHARGPVRISAPRPADLDRGPEIIRQPRGRREPLMCCFSDPRASSQVKHRQLRISNSPYLNIWIYSFFCYIRHILVARFKPRCLLW